MAFVPCERVGCSTHLGLEQFGPAVGSRGGVFACLYLLSLTAGSQSTKQVCCDWTHVDLFFVLPGSEVWQRDGGAGVGVVFGWFRLGRHGLFRVQLFLGQLELVRTNIAIMRLPERFNHIGWLCFST